jgi:iron complex transport system substrate-binding protein
MTTPQRIVSLLPSSTELLCALGLETSLVGISHECDYPAHITDRPRLTKPKINIRGDSGTIDREIRSLVQQGLSIYQIDTELLQTLQPDLIVTQDQCEVCAVPYAEVVDATACVLGGQVQIISLHPALLQDIWDDLHRIAQVTEKQKQAEEVLASLFERVQTVMAESIKVPQPPRVAIIEWLDPLILAGNWVPELIQLAGGQDGLCKPGVHSSPMHWSELQAYAPEVLVIIPCGYKLEQTLAEVPYLRQLPGWRDLPAVQQQRVYAVDGNAYFNRPGPRIVDSLEILAGLIHPDMFGEFLPPEGQVHQRLEA